MLKKTRIIDVETFISLIKESNKESVNIYKNGQCYNFARILRYVFPDHEFYYDHIQGHVYSKIGNFYYDIDGLYRGSTKNFSKLDYTIPHKPHRWHKRGGISSI